MLLAFRHNGEVDHHDSVLFDDADEKNDADQRNQAEIKSVGHQDRERADAGRWQRRQDRQRMNIAFVEDAEDQIDHDQRRQDEERHRAQRLLEGLCGALKARGQRCGRPHRRHRFLDSVGRLSQRHPLGKIEADRDSRKLALMGNRKRADRHRRPFAEHR